MADTTKSKKIGIIGSGLIGRSWSMLFASVGYNVMLYDILPEQVTNALKLTENELKKLENDKQLRGNLNAKQQFKCINGTNDIKELLKNSIFIQECIPENLQLKQNLYMELDKYIENDTIISSSTSTFLPSLLSKNMKHKSQVLVSHPVNPPYYVPLVEIVPAPWTKSEYVQFTRNIMEEIGQKPVTLTREIEGFALNRIQYAILNEAWRLIDNNILNVKDLDSVMSDGLGMRYAFLGPLETAHLNAEGMKNYLEKYSKTIYAVSETMGPTPKMEGKTAEKISKELEEICPLDNLQKRREWRDECLTKLSSLKKQI